MADRIAEAELATLEIATLWTFTDFFVAAPGGFEVGEPVFRLREIPTKSGQNQPPRAMPVRHLLIEVGEPSEETTRERIRTAITARIRER